MKTYKLLNAIRYVDARTALRFIDASVGDLQQTVVNSLGKFARTSIPGNASQTFGTEITSICKSIIAGNGVGIADKIDAFAKSLKNFRNKNISAKNVIDGAKINTALQELKKQAAALARGGAPAKSENRSAGWGKSKVRSPSNVSMVGRPAIVAPSKTLAAVMPSVERWASQTAKGDLTLSKKGEVLYQGKKITKENIPVSLQKLVQYYPSEDEAVEGIKNILQNRIERRRMSIVNSRKAKIKENEALSKLNRIKNEKHKIPFGLKEEYQNESLKGSNSRYQKMIAGKPDGKRSRKIMIAQELERVLGNRGQNIENYLNSLRAYSKSETEKEEAANKLGKEYNSPGMKGFNVSKGNPIDKQAARNAGSLINSGISYIKSGKDKSAQRDFIAARKLLRKAGVDKDSEIIKKLNSLTRDSAYRIRKRNLMTNPICYGYKF